MLAPNSKTEKTTGTSLHNMVSRFNSISWSTRVEAGGVLGLTSTSPGENWNESGLLTRESGWGAQPRPGQRAVRAASQSRVVNLGCGNRWCFIVGTSRMAVSNSSLGSKRFGNQLVHEAAVVAHSLKSDLYQPSLVPKVFPSSLRWRSPPRRTS